VSHTKNRRACASQLVPGYQLENVERPNHGDYREVIKRRKEIILRTDLYDQHLWETKTGTT
jgi:hypothetical protein